MGETNISNIGNILAAKAAARTGSESVKTQDTVEFADMMSEAGKKNAGNLMSQTKNYTADNVSKGITGDEVKSSSAEYEKYQYKDNSIQTKTVDTQKKESSAIGEKADEFAEDVKQVLKDELGVTDEEITQAMEALGIQYIDLLDRSNLANLVMTLTGSDSVNQLLCSEEFVNVLQSVGALGQELLQSLQMSETDLKEAFSMISRENEAVPETAEAVSEGTEAVEENTVQIQKTERNAAVQNEAGTEIEKTELPETTQSFVKEEAEQAVTSAGKEDMADSSGEELSGQKQEETASVNAERTKARTVSDEGTGSQSSIAAPVQDNVLEQLGNTETVQELPEYVNVRDIIEQIVDNVKVTLTGDLSKIEMQLNPESLGKIYLEVAQKEGAVTAKLQAQNAVVKEALEAQMAELKQNMNQAGIKVDSVEVTIASHEFERNLEQDAKGQEQQAEANEKAAKQRRINLNSLDELSGIMTEEETLVARMMAEQGNSVDYTV